MTSGELTDKLAKAEAEAERLRKEGVRDRTAMLAWEKHCKEAEAEVAALRARVAWLDGAARLAAETFRDYERLHREKGTLEGIEKAERNRRAAEAMDVALAKRT